MQYERDAITMLVYARNSIVTWHWLKFLRPSFTTYNQFSISFRTFHMFFLLASQQSLNCKNRTIFAVSKSMRQKKFSLSLSLSLSLTKGTSFLTRVTLRVLAFYDYSKHAFLQWIIIFFKDFIIFIIFKRRSYLFFRV